MSSPKPTQTAKDNISDHFHECIRGILDNRRLRLNVKKVNYIIEYDLKIPSNKLTPPLKHVLCECLCYYLKIWPGWRDYSSTCITDEAQANYHDKLKKYLIGKLNYIVEHEKMFLEVDNQQLTVTKMVQTDPPSLVKVTKPEAPYKLIITGRPRFLNNIGFIGSNQNVILTQHQGRPLSHIDIRQLLNYPYVKVTVNLEDITFSRTNCHKFIRYVSESKDSIICPETNFIDYIRKDNPEVKVYTEDYISEYCKQLLDIAKAMYTVNRNKIIELEVVIKQFLRDIQESNVQTHISPAGKLVNTMATNTTVCFNIGSKAYVRNKRMSFSTEVNKNQAINYCEILIPKMAYTLSTFKAVEDCESIQVSFKNLTAQYNGISYDVNVRHKFNEIINYSITYECLLCSLRFSGQKAYNEMAQHLRSQHRGEQAVVCFKCRREFAITHLAGSRWNHDCEKKQEKQITSSISNISNTEVAKTSNTNNILIGLLNQPAPSQSAICVEENYRNRSAANDVICPTDVNVNAPTVLSPSDLRDVICITDLNVNAPTVLSASSQAVEGGTGISLMPQTDVSKILLGLPY